MKKLAQWLRWFYLGPVSGLHRWPKECYALYWDGRQLPQPGWTYRADPFLFQRDGQLWLFYEEFEYLRNKGRLAVCQISPAGHWLGSPRVVLDLPYHLSYPCVFEAEGDLWLLPESGANGSLDLYRCGRFPDGWEPVGRLLSDRVIYDATPHFDGQRWWLFCLEQTASGRALQIYSSPQLRSVNWEPHPVNAQQLYAELPHQTGRPAGPLFDWAGKLIRPAQDNPDYYGQGCRFYEIVELTRERFVERRIHLPDLPQRQNHHLHQVGGFVVYDRKLRVSYWPWQRPRPLAQPSTS